MENNNKLSYDRILFIFLTILLFTSCSLVVWAYMFTGLWYAVDFQNEFSSTMIFSITATVLFVIWRYFAPDRAKNLMIKGLSLIVIENFLELPLKKYIQVYPELAPVIGQWFFLFILAEFVGLIVFLFGFNILFRKSNDH